MASHTILLIDDDESTLQMMSLIFLREGLRVLTATHPEEALGHLERNAAAVVISDQRLPGMTGADFLSVVRERWPDTVRILLTALSDAATTMAAINDGHVYRYLVKPSDPAELRAVVRDSVRFYELQRENRRLYELSASQAVALRQLNEGLERKVAERTADIEDRNHELENNLLDLIRLLASVQEMRQAGQAGHALRMAQAARWVARALDLGPSEQYDIEVAATLHDLGKVSLPDRVLHKETYSLAREDEALVRQSPLVGEAVLATIPRLRQAARIVRHQSEWFNGQGYPDGLSGATIPIGSRIIAVINAYEREGDGPGLLQGEGRRFDPAVVREFLKYVVEQREAIQGTELRLMLPQLREGMVLTRDLYTERGLLLATSGKAIDQQTLDKIRNFHRVDPIKDCVFARA